MAITTELLARLRSLDDLLELVAELGYAPCGDELGPVARRRVGLSSDTLGVRRAAVLGRRGSLIAYGLVLADAGRSCVTRAAHSLARTAPGERHLLLALDRDSTTLAVATMPSIPAGTRARQLRIPLDRPSAVAAEILRGLAPRPGESPLTLSHRTGDALSGEGLTTHFFREFTRLHARAAEAFTGMPRAGARERRDLALVVLTRVLFLYFVQAKQWLAGRSDFLPSLLDAALRSGQSFHRAVFEPLCFSTLSTPLGARTGVARALGNVPFLNGGLFERHGLERRFPEAALPDDTWRELFDELFERFHFTARERDADAIHPEMLGRVFEGLMAEERRQSSGTFFTPRPLLERTVGLALKEALAGREPDAVLRIKVLDPAVGSGAFLLEALAQLEALRARAAPGEAPAQRRRAIVRDNLFGVDVDPMAVRLAELRLWLALVADDDSSWHDVTPLPNLDFNLRQGDSLLSPLDFAEGARPEGMAGRIRAVAERRAEYFAATGRRKAALARGIRTDERAIGDAATDAAIRSLTSRLAEASSAQGRDLFGRRSRDAALTRQVAAWRRRRRELIGVRRRLAEDDALPFFSWETHFGDILASGGFDAVVGNPPWVRGERLPAASRASLAARYRSFRPTPGVRGFAHLPDISVVFVEQALRLLRAGGALGFVLPAKLLRAGYAASLRSLLRERATVVYLEDRSHVPRRDFAATVFPMIFVARSGPPDPRAPARVSIVSGRTVSGRTTQDGLPVDPSHPRSIWLPLPGGMTDAIRRALSAGPPLASRFRPRLGVKTGANEVFVRDGPRAHELPEAHRAPAILGQDIAPFSARPSAVLLAALDAWGGPCRDVPDEVRSYLKPHAALLARRADGRNARPWALFRTDLLRGRWLVLWRDIAARLEAVALHRPAGAGPIPLNTCYGVVVPDAEAAHWLSAWLNSSPVRLLAAILAERASGGAYRFSAATVGALPLPGVTAALAGIGRRAHETHEWDPHALDEVAGRALALGAEGDAGLRDVEHALR